MCKRVWHIFLIVFIVGACFFPQKICAKEMNDVIEDNGNEIYSNMRDAQIDSIFGDMSGVSVEMKGNFMGKLYVFHKGICELCPFIAIYSVVSGGFIYLIARKNKGLQRFAIFGLCIFVPVLCGILVYGLGALLGIFFHE